MQIVDREGNALSVGDKIKRVGTGSRFGIEQGMICTITKILDIDSIKVKEAIQTAGSFDPRYFIKVINSKKGHLPVWW